MGRMTRRCQPVARQFENFLDARLDDAHELRFRQVARMVAVVAHLRHRDRLAIVRGRETMQAPYSVFSRSASASAC
jgi:hypothetical protein